MLDVRWEQVGGSGIIDDPRREATGKAAVYSGETSFETIL